jgi:hypothetical protein
MRCESCPLLSQVYLPIYLGSYGVAAGAEALASSVASGVEGVVVSFLDSCYPNSYLVRICDAIDEAQLRVPSPKEP